VHVGEEIGLLVVEGFQESPIPIGVLCLLAHNHIGYLRVLVDVTAQVPRAIQDKAGISPGLVLFYQDYGLHEAGLDIGSGLVELRAHWYIRDIVSMHGSFFVLQISIPSRASLTTPSKCGAMSPLGNLIVSPSLMPLTLEMRILIVVSLYDFSYITSFLTKVLIEHVPLSALPPSV
jgi:hypothetical protein